MEIDRQHFSTRYKVPQSNLSVGYTHVLCCPCCMYFTLSFASLHKHALAHEAAQLSSYRTYTCSKCSSTSTEKYLMLEHVNIYHRNTKRPVELTEEIHTILRKTDCEEVTAPSRRVELIPQITKAPNRLEKIDCKKRVFSQSLRTYSKIQHRLKLKSRINKYILGNTKKLTKELCNQEARLYDITRDKEADVAFSNENEPIDMTIKPDLKNFKSPTTENKIDNPESHFTAEYPVAYQNIRSYLYEVLSKNPLPAGLSQSIMLRYLTAQFQSLQAVKYFNGNNFLSQPVAMNPQESNFPPRVFDGQIPLQANKLPDNSSINQRNLHRNNFSPFQNHILLEWYDNHKQKPYPSTEETKHLATICGLSYPQVKKWFANKRARSSFYQKDDIISYPNQARYNLLRFPLQMSSKLNSEVMKSLEAQFANSIDNLGMISTSSHDDSIASA